MKIEEGKYYRTRDGRKVGPMCDSGHADCIATNGEFSGGLWNFDGSPHFPHMEEDDSPTLIAEWVDEPETGTLAELNVKPGDVVMHEGGYDCKILERIPGVLAVWVVGEDRWGVDVRDSCQIYSIISRASQPDLASIRMEEI